MERSARSGWLAYVSSGLTVAGCLWGLSGGVAHDNEWYTVRHPLSSLLHQHTAAVCLLTYTTHRHTLTNYNCKLHVQFTCVCLLVCVAICIHVSLKTCFPLYWANKNQDPFQTFSRPSLHFIQDQWGRELGWVWGLKHCCQWVLCPLVFFYMDFLKHWSMWLMLQV